MLRSGLSYPIRIADHGGSFDLNEQYWRISAAHVNNDHVVVVDRTDVDSQALKRAIEEQLGHSVAISRVQAQQSDTADFDDAWLIRIPNAASAAFRRWSDRGMPIIVGDQRVTARPAPLTRACVTSQATNDRTAQAATAQLAWTLDRHIPCSHSIYARMQRRGDGAQPEVLRLTQTRGRGRLEGRWIADTRLPGVQIDTSVVQMFGDDTDRDGEWAKRLMQDITHDNTDARIAAVAGPSVGRGIRFRSGESLVIAVRGGTNVEIQSFTHDTHIFCPTPRILVLTVDRRAGSVAAAAGWDDSIRVAPNIDAQWAFIFGAASSRDTGPPEKILPDPRGPPLCSLSMCKATILCALNTEAITEDLSGKDTYTSSTGSAVRLATLVDL